MKVTGVTGAYTHSFEDLESKLDEVKEILKSASVSNDELLGVQAEIDKISNALRDTTTELDDLDRDLANNRQAIIQGNSNLGILRSESDNLKLDAQDMKDQITRLQVTLPTPVQIQQDVGRVREERDI